MTSPLPHPAPSRSTNGALFFDETGEIIGPRTTPDEYTLTKLRTLGSLRNSPEGLVCGFDSQLVYGVRFNVKLAFSERSLARVDLCPNLASDSSGWAGWTMESEMSRKSIAEKWAERVFGKEMLIKPIVLPDLAEPIHPATPGPDHPRHAVHAWGEVTSYFDSKGGFAAMWIKYNDNL